MADILQFPDNRQRKLQEVKQRLDEYDESTVVAIISEWVRGYTIPALSAAAEELELDIEDTAAVTVAANYFLKLRNSYRSVMDSNVAENINRLHDSLCLIVEEDFNESQLDNILEAKVFGVEPD